MKPTFTILGGGIAGLTAAIALKRIGICATVIEAASEFKPVGAGIVLAANAMKAYQRIGLYEQVAAVGSPVDGFTFYDGKGKIISTTFVKGLKNGPANVAIHRAELHNVLLSQLDNSEVISGRRSKGIVTTSEGYLIAFEDGSEIKSNYLIVAEGINSVIRKTVLPGARLRYAGYTCWRGIVDYTALPRADAFETWGPRGRFGFVPLNDKKIYWFACLNAPAGDEKMRQFGVKQLVDNFSSYHEPISSIIGSTREEQLLCNDIYDLKPINRYAFGNLVLIGDAAHATTPNMGQGACLAIEDAVILSNCIRKSPVVKDAFTKFEQKRMKRTHSIVHQSWRLGKIAQLEGKLACSARNFMFRCLPQKLYQKQIEKLYEVELD